MSLSDLVRRRVQKAYDSGEDIGAVLSLLLGTPWTRELALAGIKAATRRNIFRQAAIDGMPPAVCDERMETAEVLFEVVVEAFSRGMSRAYRRTIPRTFLGQFLLPTGHQAREVRERLGLRPPKTLVISPNMTCDKNCYQCYAPAIVAGLKPEEIPREMWERMKQILDPDTIRRVITEFHELGSRFVTISGGEPLAYFHKESGTRFIDGSGARKDIIGRNLDTIFLMYTNGKGMDEGVAARLAETGNVIPCLSLEGLEESTDRRRGPGSFGAVMEAMDRLRRHRVPFGTSVTVFGGPLANVEEVVSDPFVLLLKSKGVGLIWYFPWFPTMAQTTEDLALFPSPEARFHTLREGILRIRREHRVLAIDFSDGLLVNEWEDGTAKTRGCIAAGNGLLAINQDGSVDPCAFFKMGLPGLNVKEMSLLEILSHPYMAHLRCALNSSHNPLVPCFPRDHLRQMKEAARRFGAVPSSPKCRICEDDALDQGIIEYNLRCREVADRMAREKYGFDPEMAAAEAAVPESAVPEPTVPA